MANTGNHSRRRSPRWGRILVALLVLLILVAGIILALLYWDEGVITSPDGPTAVIDGSPTANSQSGYQQLESDLPADVTGSSAGQTSDPNAASSDTPADSDPADGTGSDTATDGDATNSTDTVADPDTSNNTTPPDWQTNPPVIEVIDGVTYVNGVLIANKTYSLPADYGDGLTPEAQAAFDEMAAGAAADGISLSIISGFRSYDRQSQIYNNYVARDGQAAADTYSARPGYSEHQTGLAMDINSLEQSWGQTAEGIWLAAHCAEYGFILRYPAGKEGVTGYMYEPWHVRYVGTELATAIMDADLTLEEYFGLTSVYADS